MPIEKLRNSLLYTHSPRILWEKNTRHYQTIPKQKCIFSLALLIAPIEIAYENDSRTQQNNRKATKKLCRMCYVKYRQNWTINNINEQLEKNSWEIFRYTRCFSRFTRVNSIECVKGVKKIGRVFLLPFGSIALFSNLRTA